jgi:hypothetical protein
MRLIRIGLAQDKWSGSAGDPGTVGDQVRSTLELPFDSLLQNLSVKALRIWALAALRLFHGSPFWALHIHDQCQCSLHHQDKAVDVGISF